MNSSQKYDVVIIGAGAAGLLCASTIAQSGQSVALLEHNEKPGKKILISGGGRCNFTNRKVTSDDFTSNNPHFCKSALAKYTPEDFIALVDLYNISYYEKKLGQLFCETSAKDILNALLQECEKNNVELLYNWKDIEVQNNSDEYTVTSAENSVTGKKLIVATGGLSLAEIGASDLGYRLAKQFGHKIIPPRPGLVPLNLEGLRDLSGVSLPVKITVGKHEVSDDLLFTHKGLSGPVILKASLYHNKGEMLTINWLPNIILETHLYKHAIKQLLPTLKMIAPESFIQFKLNQLALPKDIRVADLSRTQVKDLVSTLQSECVFPTSNAGFKKAEVTIGGIDTESISSQTMESNLQKDLFFIGEVLDVTGQLGGYNFQWAWSSAHACATAVRGY